MMQAGVCLRQDTETTLPELTEQHRIRRKEEELSGLECVHMAESETECAAPGLNTLEPECVTAHRGVSDVHHADTSVTKIETDLASSHTGELKTESLEFTELGYVTHLHPDQIKTETDDGGYHEAEHISDLQDIKCVDAKSNQMKCESSESLVSDLMNTVIDVAGVDHKDQTEPWQCAGESNPNCKKEINNPSLLNVFPNKTISRICVKNYTGEKPYKCTQCGKCFKTNQYLNRHVRIHTGEKPYKCVHCGKGFSVKSNLNVHMRIHTGEKPYKCTQCEKCFSTNHWLNTHQRIHTGEKPYKCIKCGNSFSKISQLNKHMSEHDEIHQIIHTGEKPYKSSGKYFSQHSQLNNHPSDHTGDKPYKCTQCGKGFCKKSNLNVHMLIHTGERPYKCGYCEMWFKTNPCLNRHQTIHTGERPYKCTYCEKCFQRNQCLNRHQIIHTGKKPYKCTLCGKSFNRIDNLYAHLRIHTDEKP